MVETTVQLQADNTALILVDIQPEYWQSGAIPKEDFPNFETNVSALMSDCRKKEALVVHIRVDYRDEKSPWKPQLQRLNPTKNFNITFDKDNVQHEDFCTPLESEIVIPKPFFGATIDTDIVKYLRDRKIETVLVCGLITAVCVHHTAYGLVNEGFNVLLVEDACAERTLERHQQCISLYGNYVYELISTKQCSEVIM